MSGESTAGAQPAWDELRSRLDLDELRACFERLAAGALGRRAVRELEVLDDDGARAAYARLDEVRALAALGERPPSLGASDPLPALAAAARYQRPFERAELIELAAFLGALERSSSWTQERRAAAPALDELLRRAPDVGRVRARLSATVDERGEVLDRASPGLTRARTQMRALELSISAAIDQLAGSGALRSLLSDGQVHRRAGRRVLAVKARSAGRVKGLVHDRSQSGETVFVEPRETLELANRLEQLEAEARAEEQRVMVELTRDVLARRGDLEAAARALGQLELASIGAAFCEAYGARAPELVDPDGAGGLLLRGARHPLLVEQQREGVLEGVVPIDARLGEDFDLLVITGPNTGGKTLAMKTVGLAAWCARHGLPVCCAEGSRVPLYAAVYADIGDGQEIRQNLSTFASHLARIRLVLAGADARSLVLLDELGGGTDPDEGAALGYAILEHLLDVRAATLVTTHIGKLKELAFRRPRAENASVAFDARTRRPLYTLLIGTPGESNALAIAAELGLAEGVIAGARERLERRDQDVTLLMADVRAAREHAERLRSSAEERLVELDQARDAAALRSRALEERGERLEAEAQRSIEERVARARESVARARPLLAQLPAGAAEELGGILDQVDRDLQAASLSDRRAEFLRGLAKGHLVYVPRYNQRCVVKKIDRARQRVRVILGKATLELPFDEVTWFEAL